MTSIPQQIEGLFYTDMEKRKILLDKIRIAVKTVVGNVEVHEDSNLRNDIGIDSLDLIDIVIELEKNLNIKIEDEIVENLVTVKNLLDHLNIRGDVKI